ncbi:MAG: aldo/keto reductase [Lysobacterales bacterium]|nr:MAG: aldo/keto reductase [Xanthomonadales bacterium]
MLPTQKNQIGSSSVFVTQLGFGGGTLGDPTEVTTDEQAHATLSAAWDRGLRYFDTAPWYGNTKSEHRIGQFLRTKPRNEFVISTKVGRVYSRPKDIGKFKNESPWSKRWTGGLPFDLRFDFSYDGVMRSYEDSLNRLGIPDVNCLTIHDLDTRHQSNEAGVAEGFRQLEEGKGFKALQSLKDQAEIEAIGAGINLVGFIPRFVERFEMDYFLLAGPYTLLDQPALDKELPLCRDKNIGIVLGGVFASGILATGAVEGALYKYQRAEPDILQKVRKITAICSGHGVALSAAALQFTLHHETVATVIPGANHPDKVISNFVQMASDIPDDLWRELKHEGYLREDAPTPG